MYKRNRKGFSLIELLAVVIILAILALITIPIVGNLIKQARINAAVVSAYGYVEATNNEIVSKQTKGEKVDETQYEISNYNIVGNLLTVKYEGRGPTNGWFILEREKVKEGEFCINGYDVKYENGKATYIKDGDICPGAPLQELVDLCTNNQLPKADKEYSISSIEGLVCLSTLVNSGNDLEGNIVHLIKDLDFSDSDSYLSNEVDTSLTTGSGFMPIGKSDSVFNGIFDGDGHKISNLHVSRGVNSGLFGVTGSNSEIKNLILENPYIYGSSNSGGLVGESSSNINGIIITGLSLTGNQNTGGIAGVQNGNIKNAEVRGNITIKDNWGDNVGGIAGYINTQEVDMTISDVLVNATIYGKSNSGGLVGKGDKQTHTVSGLVEGGRSGGYYYSGKATGSDVHVGVIYVSNTVTTGNSSHLPGNDGVYYDSTKHYIGALDDVIDTYYGADDDNDGYYFDYETDSSSKIVLKKVNDHSFDTQISGSGTSSDPYILSTERDFKDASLLTNGGYYFKLGNNIDASTFNQFYQLGTTTHYFNGHLDGDNKTISNLNLQSGRFSGLIAYLNNGSVKDLYVEDSVVKNCRNADGTGMIAGYAINSSFENIHLDTVTIQGTSNSGGVAGYSTSSFNVIYINAISLTGNQNTGGIAGVQNGNIKNAEVRGNITIKDNWGDNVGGIAGYINTQEVDMTISDVLVNATIYGKSNSGGLVGKGDKQTHTVSGLVEGGRSGGYYYSGKATGSDVHVGVIYVSNTVTTGNSSHLPGNDGVYYDSTKHYIGALDEAIDTYYGADDDNDGYYFDYETDSSSKIVLKKVNNHSFDTQISGSGTSSDPYILSTERDFKDASLLTNGGYYFKLGNNIDASTFNQFYQLGTTTHYFNGHLDGDNHIISNLTIEGGRFSGLVAYLNNGSVKNLIINNGKVTNRRNADGTGMIVGYAINSLIENINLNTITVLGTSNSGGVAGYSTSNIKAINIKGLSLTGNQNTGGIAGVQNGDITDATVRGNITIKDNWGDNVGGIAGYINTQEVDMTISDVLVNATVYGKSNSGGLVGARDKTTHVVYGVVEGGRSGGYYYSGKATGSGVTVGLIYVSDSVTTGNSSSLRGNDGTSYSSSCVNRLDYYTGINYTSNSVQYPLLDSSATGDVNNSGYWFDYDAEGYIIVVKAENTPVCTENCDTNPEIIPGPVIIEKFNETTGTCPDGDVTAPVCTFESFEAVPRGIRAYFSCTDETSVPTIVSMFNATTKEHYTAQMILDRGGTTKTGTVSGTTRSIKSTWTDQTVPSNPPQEGLCYFYQFTAKDACGNESDWVTTYCAYGFNNGVTITGSE